MDQKWLLIAVFLGFCHRADRVAQEGEKIDISCKPKDATGASMIVWFRVLDNFRMEFIGSFSTTGIQKSAMENFDTIFSYTANRLTLKSFKKQDSGTYSCALLYQGTKLAFGEATKIYEVQTVAKTEAPPTCTTISVITPAPCTCEKNNGGASSSSMSCTPIILGPLAGGCGLLLLLLIVTIFYCNRIRTRRCPHHHKRRPRQPPPEKLMMADRYV